MNCRKARSYILVSHDEELSYSAREELLRHVENCTRCQKEKLLIEQTRVGFKSLPEEKLSDDFNNRLFARIYSSPRTEETRIRNVPPIFGYWFRKVTPILAALSAILVTVWFGVGQLTVDKGVNSQFAAMQKEFTSYPAESSINSENSDFFQASGGLAFSVAKLESLQVAAALKDNRLMLNRLRLEATRRFGGFGSSWNNDLIPIAADNYTAPRRYIYPVVRTVNSDRTPY